MTSGFAVLKEMFEMDFMIRAFVCGTLIAFLSSLLGVFVVQRGLSFLGDGLAHATLGGVALGLFLGVEPLWIALPFTLLVALAMTWLKRRSSLSSDTSVGIFFAVSAALGILFMSLKRDYSPDAFSYLFGSILSVTEKDIGIATCIFLACLAVLPKLWTRWAYATFDRELAKADRVPVDQDDYWFSLLVALTVVISVKVVGVILVASFLVIPASTARLWSARFSQMTILSVAFGVIGLWAGLVLSYVGDLPSGAVIVLFQAFVFFISLVFVRRV